MKYLRLTCAAALLTLAFTLSASADTCGDMSCPGFTSHAPQSTVTGEILQPIVEAIATAVLSLS